MLIFIVTSLIYKAALLISKAILLIFKVATLIFKATLLIHFLPVFIQKEGVLWGCGGVNECGRAGAKGAAALTK